MVSIISLTKSGERDRIFARGDPYEWNPFVSPLSRARVQAPNYRTVGDGGETIPLNGGVEGHTETRQLAADNHDLSVGL